MILYYRIGEKTANNSYIVIYNIFCKFILLEFNYTNNTV